MSDILSYIKNTTQKRARLVGVKYEQLEQLIKQAIALHTQKQQEIEAEKIRIINKGGGRKVKLSTEEPIMLTLVYLRHLTLRVTLVPRYRCANASCLRRETRLLPRGDAARTALVSQHFNC